MAAPRHQAGGSGPTVQILQVTPYHHGPLRYRVAIALGSIVIRDISILQQGSHLWTALPTAPRIDGKGKAMRRQGGGYVHTPILEIPAEASKRRFDRAVLDALRTYLSEEARYE